MATIKAFEDLRIWQLARELANDIYELTQKEKFSKDYSLKDQINRAAGSVMDNIAEGFERGGNKELLQFLFIAKGSCGEVRSQLNRAFDRMHINANEFEVPKNKAITTSKQISRLITYLKDSGMKGEKYVSEPEDDYHLDLES